MSKIAIFAHKINKHMEFGMSITVILLIRYINILVRIAHYVCRGWDGVPYIL